MLDIFKSRLFETTTLTASINDQQYVPSYINDLGLFEEQGVSTTSVVIERQGSTIAVLPTSARGAPGTPIQGDKRKGIPLLIPHVKATAQLQADEVQNVRAFGSPDQLAGVTQKRDEKTRKISSSLDLTLEYHRLGCIQGLVLDEDGSVILDIFDAMGIEELDEITIAPDATYDPNNPAKAGAIRQKLRGLKRETSKALGFKPKGWLCFAGDDLYDQVADAPEVRATYLAQQQASDLRSDGDAESFTYGGITFVNYVGAGDVAIDDDVGRIVPLGVPGLFRTDFGPADYLEAVNTNGLPKYMKAVMDPSGYNRFIEMEGQMNDLNYCTKPQALRKLKLA